MTKAAGYPTLNVSNPIRKWSTSCVNSRAIETMRAWPGLSTNEATLLSYGRWSRRVRRSRSWITLTATISNRLLGRSLRGRRSRHRRAVVRTTTGLSAVRGARRYQSCVYAFHFQQIVRDPNPMRLADRRSQAYSAGESGSCVLPVRWAVFQLRCQEGLVPRSFCLAWGLPGCAQSPFRYP